MLGFIAFTPTCIAAPHISVGAQFIAPNSGSCSQPGGFETRPYADRWRLPGMFPAGGFATPDSGMHLDQPMEALAGRRELVFAGRGDAEQQARALYTACGAEPGR